MTFTLLAGRGREGRGGCGALFKKEEQSLVDMDSNILERAIVIKDQVQASKHGLDV